MINTIEKQDIEYIIELSMRVFPDALSTKIGYVYSLEYMKYIYDCFKDTIYIYKEDGEILGMIIAYPMSKKNFKKEFQKSNYLSLVKYFLFHPITFFNIIKRKNLR